MPTNGLGWGLDYWGVGPWGILPPDLGSFELESFFATSERTVRVTFTQAALVGTPLLAGAALNVRTWSLATNDTPTVNPIILGVREIEGSEGRQFELYTLRKLPRYPSTLTLSCATILSAASAPLAGVPSLVAHGAAQARTTIRDNRSTPSDLKSAQVPGATLAAVLKPTAGGDYEVESGDELLRKMVIRRLTTEPGEFAFLPENFGIRMRVKSAIRGGGGLNDLREQIEAQVRQEPDVVEARAVLSYKPNLGLLQVQIRMVRKSTGRPVDANFDVPTEG